jgi:hypothetical protein
MRPLPGLLLPTLLIAGCAAPSNHAPTSTYAPQPLEQRERPVRDVEPLRQRAATSDDVLTSLEGCVIVANDGQPLGVITQNEFAANSILNEFGKYGSEFSATSIFNQFGKYGGEFSRLSPFNQFTRTPPQIVSVQGRFVAYLTKNKFMTPAIDPHLLIGLLKSAK